MVTTRISKAKYLQHSLLKWWRYFYYDGDCRWIQTKHPMKRVLYGCTELWSDVVENPLESKDYTIKVVTKKSVEKVIRRTYDKKGLNCITSFLWHFFVLFSLNYERKIIPSYNEMLRACFTVGKSNLSKISAFYLKFSKESGCLYIVSAFKK